MHHKTQPEPGHLHPDFFTSPIHACSDSDSTELGKYWDALSSKTAKLAL